MLTESQIKHFQENGYVAVPEFFTGREVRGIRAELDRLRREGAFRNVSTEGDGKTHSKEKENLQICPLYDKSEFFRALPFDPKIVQTIPRLIGPDVVLHLDQVFLKPGRHGAGTNWHQDNAYFKIPDPMRGTAMWTAVHDATRANGTIEVMPGLVRQSLEHSRDPMSDHHIRCFPDESRAVPIELAAGGVVFFAYGVPHCTRANTTDHERAGVAYHFLEAGQVVAGYKCNGARVAGAGADGGKAVYGVDLRGAWQGLVDKAVKA